jgi:hypothetical protein
MTGTKDLYGYGYLGNFANSGTVLSFSAIPQTYRHLRIIATCQSAAAGANTAFRMTFNNVTSANYTYGWWNWGTLGGGSTVSTTSFYIGPGPGAGRTSDDQVGLSTIEIPNYSAANINHGMSYVFEGWDGTTTLFGHGSGATNVGPAAVSSIQLRETGTNALGPRAKAELWAI